MCSELSFLLKIFYELNKGRNSFRPLFLLTLFATIKLIKMVFMKCPFCGEEMQQGGACMFRLDIDFFPLLILVPAIVQFTICLLAGKKMRFCIGILPFAFLSFAGYGYLADQAWNLPYPGLFEPDFMMSSATAGFLAFGAMFIGTILGTILWALWAIFRKMIGD